MRKSEMKIIRNLTSQLKELHETMTKSEIIRFLDYTIIMRQKLGHTNEFMEKLYFIRYYINNVAK